MDLITASLDVSFSWAIPVLLIANAQLVTFSGRALNLRAYDIQERRFRVGGKIPR